MFIDESRHSVVLQPPEKAYMQRISEDLRLQSRPISHADGAVEFRYSVST
jgi:hypothetical protein